MQDEGKNTMFDLNPPFPNGAEVFIAPLVPPERCLLRNEPTRLDKTRGTSEGERGKYCVTPFTKHMYNPLRCNASTLHYNDH